MINSQINCMALGFIVHCMQDALQCAGQHPESICEDIEDSLQAIEGLRQWLPKSPYAFMGELSEADCIAIMLACHAIMGWKDASY